MVPMSDARFRDVVLEVIEAKRHDPLEDGERFNEHSILQHSDHQSVLRATKPSEKALVREPGRIALDESDISLRERWMYWTLLVPSPRRISCPGHDPR